MSQSKNGELESGLAPVMTLVYSKESEILMCAQNFTFSASILDKK